MKTVASWHIVVSSLMALFVFLNPFPHTTSLKEISIYSSILIGLILYIAGKFSPRLKAPVTVPFALFAVWGAGTLFFALDKMNSVHDFFFHLVKYLAFFYLLLNFFETREKFKYLVWVIVLSATSFSAWAIVYFYFYLGNSFSTQLGTTFTEIPTNIIGTVTVFASVLMLNAVQSETKLYRKGILILCLAISSVATFLTQTRGALLAMAVILISLVLYSKRKILIILFGAYVLIGVVALPVGHRFTLENIKKKIIEDPRTNIVYTYLEVIKDYPITGIGFGLQTYADEALLRKYNSRVPPEFRQTVPHKAPHNLFVDVAVRLGFIGLILYLYLFVSFVRMGWNLLRRGKDEFIQSWGAHLMVSFFAFTIQGMFENVHSGPPAIVFYTIVAMMTILWWLNGEHA